VLNTNRTVAESIIRAKLVKEGKVRLEALNEEFMLALEDNLSVKDIVRRRKAIRGVINKDLSSLSIAELAALTLDKALAL
jgi:hypothetical protein